MSFIGNLSLLLALAAAIYSAIAYGLGARTGNQTFLRSARGGLLLACGFTTLSVLILLIAILNHNFSLDYVAEYTSLNTPLGYLISAVWAGNAGSLLFWAWLTSICAVIVVLPKRDNNRELVPYASVVMMLVLAFFLILIFSVANPFQQTGFPPVDGRGLNPMLENPGMVIHPPTLLIGYVGFTVPFAFAIAALLRRKLGDNWLLAVRRWALAAWLFLGIGNLIGAWWAYVELGWGGYWAWDPVENAGLMPWLVATALLHSIMMQRRKGMFRIWTMILIITTFSLVVFGTFITRSGVLSSVHTYGVSVMGPFFVIFLLIVLGGSLGLLISRRDALKGDGDVEKLVSREGTFLLNNLLLVGATLVIFIGTVFPGLSEAVRGVKIEVGQSFFNQVNGPLFLAIILLIGACTLITWRSMLLRNFLRAALWPLVISVILVIILFITGVRHGYALAGILICTFVILAILYKWLTEAREYRRTAGSSLPSACWRLLWRHRTRYGGYIVHISIVIIAIGVIGSSIYATERNVSLQKGQSVTVEDYTFAFTGLTSQETPDKQIVGAGVTVSRDSKIITELTPQKFFHRSFDHPVSEVAIRSTLARDVYLILAGWEADGTAALTIKIIPLVIWIWIGGGIFFIGGLIAFWPSGTRSGAPRAAPQAPAAGTGLESEIENQIRQLRRGRVRFCPECGTAVRARDRFCAGCGKDLDGEEKID